LKPTTSEKLRIRTSIRPDDTQLVYINKESET